MWGLDSTVTYKKECVITRVYTCIPLLVHVHFRCVSHATHWNCCFAQEARFKKVVSIPRYHQSSALIQLLNSRCWFLSHDSFWTTGWLELASLIRRRRKFYYIRGCGVFVKNICCWNIWKWGSEQWAENAQLTSIRAVGDTLSPFYLTYTEVASENLYLGLHTACIMIHIFSASACGHCISLEVQHFICLGLFKLTVLTLTDTSSRRMNCHIRLANVLRCNGGERNADDWNARSPQVQPDDASPSNNPKLNHVIRIFTACRTLIITSVICNSLVSVWQLKHIPQGYINDRCHLVFS